MTTPDAITLAYRETGEIAAREYPMRMALCAGVAVLVALLGYPLFAIIWWPVVGAVSGLHFLTYRAYFVILARVCPVPQSLVFRS